MNLTASVTIAKNGKRHYTLLDGETVVDTRKSDRDYSHLAVTVVRCGEWEREKTGKDTRPIVEYAGRLDLAQKRVDAYLSRDAKRETKWVVETYVVPVDGWTPVEGVTRCDCGAKYWDNDTCASCGSVFTP